jgi:hypothetical protein
MRLAISRCVAVESPRGWKIAKERAAFKVDVIVALAMACHAAVQGQNDSTYTLDPFQPDFVDLDADSAGQPPTAAQQASRVAGDYVVAFCAAHGLFI